jgi:unsaturated rhamnogalacturonyl hydrolase
MLRTALSTLLVLATSALPAQEAQPVSQQPVSQQPVSQQIAQTILHVFPHGRGEVWNYDEGTVLDGMDTLWSVTANPEYLRYIQQCVDRFVTDDGSIRTYKAADQSLDMILMGRQLIFLHRVTGEEKYAKAALLLYNQLEHQPRTPEGGFWHKKRYPNQMWLDSLYMAEPFYAEYARDFHHPADFADINRQFQLLEDHARDPKTGLLYHGWDSAHQQKWANPTTGDSPSLWSRAMGWYAMGMVDVLDSIPAGNPARAPMIARLNRFAKAIVAVQDPDGLWWQIADKPSQPGNYEESSASAMFVYTLQKGVRKGYLPATFHEPARKGYDALLAKFVKPDAQGILHLSGTVDAVGLGGTPYRDGTFAYYTSVPQVTDDARGLGALLLAAVEMERPAATPTAAKPIKRRAGHSR